MSTIAQEPLIFSASNPEGVKLAVESGCDVNMEVSLVLTGTFVFVFMCVLFGPNPVDLLF